MLTCLQHHQRLLSTQSAPSACSFDIVLENSNVGAMAVLLFVMKRLHIHDVLMTANHCVNQPHASTSTPTQTADQDMPDHATHASSTCCRKGPQQPPPQNIIRQHHHGVSIP
jgi:hypothetical protein